MNQEKATEYFHRIQHDMWYLQMLILYQGFTIFTDFLNGLVLEDYLNPEKCQNALCNLQECVNLHMPLIIGRRLQPRLPHTTIISI